jgi:hypothetical protein
MATIDERLVSKVVSEVLARLQTQTRVASSGQSSFGVYEKMEDACDAAHRSFEKLRELGVLRATQSESGHPQDVRGEGEGMGVN